ncbi:hypothetical protein AAF712_015955 [Marasmius tenuissimus]|uniref:F-box domain-containing protein n=1 Tax=Marasmius tenuissimus TaxID=585030 RepID=A0ABR2Z6X9_9AGAR
MQTMSMPAELWAEVFILLPRADVASLCVVDKFFYNLAAPLLCADLRFRSADSLERGLSFRYRNIADLEDTRFSDSILMPRIDVPPLDRISAQVEVLNIGSHEFTAGYPLDRLYLYNELFFDLDALRVLPTHLPSLQTLTLFDIRSSSSALRSRLIWEGFTEFVIEDNSTPPSSPRSPPSSPVSSLPHDYLDNSSFGYTFNLRKLELIEVDHSSISREENSHVMTQMLMSPRYSFLSVDWDVIRRILTYAPQYMSSWQQSLVSECLEEFVLVGTEDMDLGCWVDDEPQPWTVSPEWASSWARLLASNDSNLTSLTICDGRSNHFDFMGYGLSLPKLQTYKGCIPFIRSMLGGTTRASIRHFSTHFCSGPGSQFDMLGELVAQLPGVVKFELGLNPVQELRLADFRELGFKVFGHWSDLEEVHVMYMDEYHEPPSQFILHRRRSISLDLDDKSAIVDEWSDMCSGLRVVRLPDRPSILHCAFGSYRLDKRDRDGHPCILDPEECPLWRWFKR